MSAIKIDAFCPVGIGGTKGIDTTHLKIFVGGLLPTHTSKDLYDIFSPFGTIRESVVIPDRFRVRSRCYGFVKFYILYFFQDGRMHNESTPKNDKSQILYILKSKLSSNLIDI